MYLRIAPSTLSDMEFKIGGKKIELRGVKNFEFPPILINGKNFIVLLGFGLRDRDFLWGCF